GGTTVGCGKSRAAALEGDTDLLPSRAGRASPRPPRPPLVRPRLCAPSAVCPGAALRDPFSAGAGSAVSPLAGRHAPQAVRGRFSLPGGVREQAAPGALLGLLRVALRPVLPVLA